jgi:nitrilase
MNNHVRVAIIQARPVYLDMAASLAKAVTLIEEAARAGAKLVAFGETWLTGYPTWLDNCPDVSLWDHAPTKELFARLRAESPTVPGPEVARLSEVAGDLGITLVMGLNERVDRGPGNGTLYNSLITFGPDGRVINHHRKLVPTYTERLVWGPGDGVGLRAVDTPAGRVGGLICWEHWMPAARQVLHADGEQIHVAVWPTVHEMHQVASRHYAFEGRCFVLAAGLLMDAGDLPPELKLSESASHRDGLLVRGGSAIIGPDGRYLVEPVYDEERILIADLDLSVAEREKMTLDVTGHYSRPDVFELRVSPGKRGAGVTRTE